MTHAAGGGHRDANAAVALLRAQLQTLLTHPPSRASAEDLLAFLRHALPRLRTVGCSAGQMRKLLLPAVLQLLLSEALPAHAQADMHLWAEQLLRE
jgi:hypothetical protein